MDALSLILIMITETYPKDVESCLCIPIDAYFVCFYAKREVIAFGWQKDTKQQENIVNLKK